MFFPTAQLTHFCKIKKENILSIILKKKIKTLHFFRNHSYCNHPCSLYIMSQAGYRKNIKLKHIEAFHKLTLPLLILLFFSLFLLNIPIFHFFNHLSPTITKGKAMGNKNNCENGLTSLIPVLKVKPITGPHSWWKLITVSSNLRLWRIIFPLCRPMPTTSTAGA